MRRYAILISAGAVVACALCSDGAPRAAASAPQQKKKGTNDVVGAVWEYEARETPKKTSREIQSGRFRATLDGKLYNVKAGQIGTYAYTNKAQDGVRLTITQGKLKGTSDLVKTQFNPPTWAGSWKLEDGTTAHLVIRMIRD